MKKLILTITILLLVLLGFAQTTVTDKMVIVHRSWGDYVLDATGASVQINGADSLTIGNRIFYIDPATGDDTNTGLSTSLAWRTVDRADTTLTAGDIVALKRGQEHSGTVVVNSSGTASDKISYTSFGLGANPILKGTTEVTGSWSQLARNANIYFTVIPGLGNPNRLLIDDEIATISQYPSASTLDPYDFWTGYATTTSFTDVGDFYNDTIINDNNLPAVNLIGSRAVFRSVGWANYWQTIVNMTNDSTFIVDYGIYSLSAGTPYFIVNNPDLIDGNNQYAYRGDTLFLRLADAPANHTIEYSSSEFAFYAESINNVQIKRLNIKGYNRSGVFLNAASTNVTVADCNFDKNYHSALTAQNASNSGIDFVRNTVQYTSHCAVYLKGTNMLIDNNSISRHSLRNNIGVDIYQPLSGNLNNAGGAGIGISTNGDNNTISNNTLDSLGYIGISLIGKNTLVEKNQVYHCDLVLEDGAAYYSHEDGSGSIVRYNIAGNNGFPTSTNFTHGYYGDLTTKGVTWYENVAYGNHGHGALFNAPDSTTFENNTLFNNVQESLNLDYYSGYVPRNNIFKYNVLFSKTTTSDLYFVTDFHADSTLLVDLDSNYYCNPFLTTGVPTTYDSNPFTLYSLFETQFISDTISANIITNSTFDANASGWYRPWVSSSPIGTGGAIGEVHTTANRLLQTLNINYTPTITGATFLFEFDVYEKGTAGTKDGYSVGPSPALSFPNFSFSQGSTYHYKNYAVYGSASAITDRVNVGVTATVGDSIFLDNVYLFEVTTAAVDQDAKSQLFVNSTTVPQIQTLGAYTWKDIDGNPVTSLTLQPFTSQILIRED